MDLLNQKFLQEAVEKAVNNRIRDLSDTVIVSNASEEMDDSDTSDLISRLRSMEQALERERMAREEDQRELISLKENLEKEREANKTLRDRPIRLSYSDLDRVSIFEINSKVAKNKQGYYQFICQGVTPGIHTEDDNRYDLQSYFILCVPYKEAKKIYSMLNGRSYSSISPEFNNSFFMFQESCKEIFPDCPPNKSVKIASHFKFVKNKMLNPMNAYRPTSEEH